MSNNLYSNNLVIQMTSLLVKLEELGTVQMMFYWMITLLAISGNCEIKHPNLESTHVMTQI